MPRRAVVAPVVVMLSFQRHFVAVGKVSSVVGKLRGKTVAVLGLAFKPNTDDMREAPSIPLTITLQDMGAKVCAYDPAGMEQAKPMLAGVAFCRNEYECADVRRRW